MPSWAQVTLSKSSSNGAEAAGQGQESVGQLGHQGLRACMLGTTRISVTPR
jgi:hypothetical protein